MSPPEQLRYLLVLAGQSWARITNFALKKNSNSHYRDAVIIVLNVAVPLARRKLSSFPLQEIHTLWNHQPS